MKLARGVLQVVYEMIDPSSGLWIKATSATYTSNESGFRSAEMTIDAMSGRADRRNAKVIYRPGYPTEDLVIETPADIERLVNIKWSPVEAAQPTDGQWIAVYGTFTHGFVFIGPYPTAAAASSANDGLGVVKLTKP